MELIRLTKDTIIKSFDCGDADLNDFILNDAKLSYLKDISAIPFYERNGFKTLLPEEDDVHTRTMYFDILSLDEV